jgi:hypothetical protein
MSEKLYQLAEYISRTNPEGVVNIALSNGYKAPKTQQAMTGFILKFLSDKGEEGYRKIIEIHPDRDLILASLEEISEGPMNFIGQIPNDSYSIQNVPKSKFPLVEFLLIAIICLIILSVCTR